MWYCRAVESLVQHHADNLVWLDLDGAELTDDAFSYLYKCQSLVKLTVSFAELLTDETLLHIQALNSEEHILHIHIN